MRSEAQPVAGAGSADAQADSGEAVPGLKVDLPAFEELYALHHDFVWHNVLRMGVPWAMADDATQDVFVVVARKLGEFEGRSTVRTWLFAIMIRVVRDLRRREFRRDACRRAFAHSQHARASAEHEDSACRRSDAARTLHELLQRIDERKRLVFIMSELESMTGPEIARALDISLPASYARLRAAKRELAHLAQRHCSGEPGIARKVPV